MRPSPHGYSVRRLSAADHPDNLGRVIAVSSPSPRSAGAPGVTDWLTGIGTVALAAVTVVTPIATIYITITDRRNAEAARRRDRQQDSAQRLLGHVAGIVWYFRLIPGIYQWVTTDLLNNPRALGCLNAVRALETGMYADISGLGDARAAGQYRQLVSHVLAVAPGVDEGMGERTSKALRRSAVFVRESLQNLIEYGQSLPGQTSFPSLEPPGDKAGASEPGHEGTAGRHRRPESPADEEDPSEPGQ